jgi:hypothetical protein
VNFSNAKECAMCRQRLQNRRSARARGEVSKSLPLVPPEVPRSVREPDPEFCYVCLGAVSTDGNPIFFCHRCPSVNGPVNGIHYNCAMQNKLPVPATASGVSDEVFLWSCFKCEQPAPAVPVKSVPTPCYLCNQCSTFHHRESDICLPPMRKRGPLQLLERNAVTRACDCQWRQRRSLFVGMR